MTKPKETQHPLCDCGSGELVTDCALCGRALDEHGEVEPTPEHDELACAADEQAAYIEQTRGAPLLDEDEPDDFNDNDQADADERAERRAVDPCDGGRIPLSHCPLCDGEKT